MTKFLGLRMCGYSAHPLEWISSTVSTVHLFEWASGPILKLSHQFGTVGEIYS